MGKIYDALEKADNHTVGKIARIPEPMKRKREQKNQKKVVPLVNSQNRVSTGQLDNTIVTYHLPQSVEAELFKVLRTNLLFPDTGIPPKTILVTSALPGDGKSFVCSNLAVSIAKGVEEHVLLIDGDIRKPAIHTRFGLGQGPGLSEYLSNGDDIGHALRKTTIPKLTIIPAGKPPSNPTELVSSKKMQKLLVEVKNRYEDRYIIIDSPPPTMASETNAIAKFVDGILIVIKAGKTPKEAVADTIEKIGKEKIIGIVLNHADRSTRQYYGYGKSYYREESRKPDR